VSGDLGGDGSENEEGLEGEEHLLKGKRRWVWGGKGEREGEGPASSRNERRGGRAKVSSSEDKRRKREKLTRRGMG